MGAARRAGGRYVLGRTRAAGACSRDTAGGAPAATAALCRSAANRGLTSPPPAECAKMDGMKAREEILTKAAAASVDAEREAVHAAAFVALFVAIPAVVAAGAVFVMFALTSLVLLAPAVALTLTWVAWRYARPSHAPRIAAAEGPPPSR